MSRFQPPATHDGLVNAEFNQLEEILSTQPFKFLVGPDLKAAFIHRGLVSQLSAPLRALTTGDMKESHEGCVTWDDVDEDVFARFAQFAYTGAYANFEPTDNPDATEESSKRELTARVVEKMVERISTPHSPQASNRLPIPPPAPFFNAEALTFPSIWYNTQPTPTLDPNEQNKAFRLPYSLVSYFDASMAWSTRGGDHSAWCGHLQPQAQPSGRRIRARATQKRKLESVSCNCGSQNPGAPSDKKRNFIADSFVLQDDPAVGGNITTAASKEGCNFENVFVGHARVWVFADRYVIPSLMDLAGLRLRRELSNWTITAETFVEQFGGLVRYVYDGNTFPGCQLRLIVTQFAACVVEDVCELEDWPSLFNEVPDFAAELISQMRYRIV
ncbi:hypothetical protein QBC46DRAFT_377696 [Diplogelasinospora grovesii]|uniref:BTB domain-containing protein n=1 Tax=Diplogelasinospora grovesii TaxID=303347 RepID=A0AAN6S869_9PEZI|nr:hypothetical protein QBC46DRAFT_377696 [Diplogelasinospora grovesii]